MKKKNSSNTIFVPSFFSWRLAVAVAVGGLIHLPTSPAGAPEIESSGSNLFVYRNLSSIYTHMYMYFKFFDDCI